MKWEKFISLLTTKIHSLPIDLGSLVMKSTLTSFYFLPRRCKGYNRPGLSTFPSLYVDKINILKMTFL